MNDAYWEWVAELPPEYKFEKEYEQMMTREADKEHCEYLFEESDCVDCEFRRRCPFRKELRRRPY